MSPDDVKKNASGTFIDVDPCCPFPVLWQNNDHVGQAALLYEEYASVGKITGADCASGATFTE
ncbi:hypothetical protein DZS_10540 [Dickeya ananatis]